VRALIGSAANREVYATFKDGAFTLILSKEMLEELIDVLSRPKFGIDFAEIKNLLHFIKAKATIVEITKNIKACRDHTDDIVLEAAISANANVIVSNDNDLLELNPFEDIPILTTPQFLRMLKKQ
jgi:putative PIN family toxin of toxin-antitoxin system